MGRKIDPISYRLGINKNWQSRWIPQNRKDFATWLEEDEYIRETVMAKFSKAGIAAIEIERTPDQYRVYIRTSRPGLVIGRGGEGILRLEQLLRKRIKSGTSLAINVEELKRTEVAAAVVAQNIAWDLERRMRYRRVIKRYLDMVMQNREVEGAKIMVAGRLDGADIARKEHLEAGKLPLTTIRANIDYAQATASTKYGAVGVKVWLYKGEVFEK
ncbi:MAG: 30S ribosomal protein S3 [Candidatus Colwellbacteria bacterium]|nr:30S ribosomal protein S3 [Candidatus Colwellbacteria bacterium]